jgi:TPR repeat protein
MKNVIKFLLLIALLFGTQSLNAGKTSRTDSKQATSKTPSKITLRKKSIANDNVEEDADEDEDKESNKKVLQQLLAQIKKMDTEKIKEGKRVFGKGRYHFERKDYKTAFPFLQEAASEYEFPEAYLLLGAMYKDGLGCTQSLKEALFHLHKACKLEAEGAEEAFEEILEEVGDILKERESVPPSGMYI